MGGAASAASDWNQTSPVLAADGSRAFAAMDEPGDPRAGFGDKKRRQKPAAPPALRSTRAGELLGHRCRGMWVVERVVLSRQVTRGGAGGDSMEGSALS